MAPPRCKATTATRRHSTGSLTTAPMVPPHPRLLRPPVRRRASTASHQRTTWACPWTSTAEVPAPARPCGNGITTPPGARGSTSPVGDNLYWLEPQNALGDALDVYQINPNNGASLDIWPNGGQINQLWYVIDPAQRHLPSGPDLNPTQTLDQPGGNTSPCPLQAYSLLDSRISSGY